MAKSKHKKRGWSLLWAARFVGKWEGFLPYAYLDTIASPAVWTGAFGHTSAAGPPPVGPGDHFTEARGREILAEDLRDIAFVLEKNCKVHLTVRQRIALLSIGYNCGAEVLTNSKLMDAVNRGDFKEAADRFLEWSHAGGVVVQGLLNRRRAERWMMLHSARPHRHKAVPTHGKAHGPGKHQH